MGNELRAQFCERGMGISGERTGRVEIGMDGEDDCACLWQAAQCLAFGADIARRARCALNGEGFGHWLVEVRICIDQEIGARERCIGA